MGSIVLLRDRHGSTYQKYLKILMACKEADIDPPPDVDKFFGGNGIDDDPDYPLEIDFQPKAWKDDYNEGFEIDLSELPDGVKTIRFYSSCD